MRGQVMSETVCVCVQRGGDRKRRQGGVTWCSMGLVWFSRGALDDEIAMRLRVRCRLSAFFSSGFREGYSRIGRRHGSQTGGPEVADGCQG